MRRLSIFVVVGFTAVAAPARADHSSINATANGDVAATDNVFAVSAAANPQSDLFFQIRPGILFVYDAPRMIQELTAEVDFLEYVRHSDKPSITLRGGWKGFFLPGPRSELTLAATGGTGQLNALTGATAPDQTGVTVVPGNRADIIQADASEYFSWQSSKESRISQTAVVRYTNTDDAASQPVGMNTSLTVDEIGLAGSFERTFESTAVSIEAGASFLKMLQLSPTPAMSRDERQINPRGSLVVRRDLSEHWSASADGGVVYVNPITTACGSVQCADPFRPTELHPAAPFPIFGAVLAYTELRGRATLNVRRAVTPNQFIAQNTVTESAIAQIALPLPWLDPEPAVHSPKLFVLASVGAERSRLIDPNSSQLVGAFEVARVDAGLAWTPRPGTTYGLRYEFTHQTGDATALMVTPAYNRNTVFFTFAVRYPDKVAARVPRRLDSVRADRKDLAPVGAEPVVPDPAEQGAEGGGE